MHTRARGGTAERAACDFLTRAGYRVLETNFTLRGGEIDVIAEDESSVLCFIEVRSRTRAEGDFGEPFETIDTHKQARIARAAEIYIVMREVDPDRAMRFDVVSVVFEGQGDAAKCELIRDAFEAR